MVLPFLLLLPKCTGPFSGAADGYMMSQVGIRQEQQCIAWGRSYPLGQELLLSAMTPELQEDEVAKC